MDKYNRLFSADTVFARFMNKLWDIILTGLLWLLCSLPVITLGASSAAAYQCVIKIVRGKNSGVIQLFFQVFKDNLKQTIILKIFGTLFVAWLLFDIIYLYGYGTDFSKTLSIILYIVMAVYIMIVSYLYPLISRFDETRFTLFKLSFYLTFRYIILSLGTLIIFGAFLYAVYLMPWTIFLMPGFYQYLKSFPVKKAIGMMVGDKQEEDEEPAISPDKKKSPKFDKEDEAEKKRQAYEARKQAELEERDHEGKAGTGETDNLRTATPDELMGPKTVKVKRRKLKNPWKKRDFEGGVRPKDYRDKTGEYDPETYGRAPVETEEDGGPKDRVVEKD